MFAAERRSGTDRIDFASFAGAVVTAPDDGPGELQLTMQPTTASAFAKLAATDSRINEGECVLWGQAGVPSGELMIRPSGLNDPDLDCDATLPDQTSMCDPMQSDHVTPDLDVVRPFAPPCSIPDADLCTLGTRGCGGACVASEWTTPLVCGSTLTCNSGLCELDGWADLVGGTTVYGPMQVANDSMVAMPLSAMLPVTGGNGWPADQPCEVVLWQVNPWPAGLQVLVNGDPLAGQFPTCADATLTISSTVNPAAPMAIGELLMVITADERQWVLPARVRVSEEGDVINSVQVTSH